ncbi:sensor domain-containing diguanylate cyclase [Azospira restricta]|uniref:diguanylate cyclase n=1 Tax=Azospira restricta TaxID=404405 RepID=A0A974SS42_9RHOO|nr:GGDEF domain-containing protein [Azospira restricta]QRJ65498.1 diguanylate cyclase [Azospira restricta]
MPPLSNPIEIAREAFRLLATRRIAPTPENYRTVYHEIAGTRAEEVVTFPAEQLKSLQQGLPRATPAQLRLARELEQAAKEENWTAYRDTLVRFIEEQSAVESLPWGELINSLLREWESSRAGLTPGKKREALEHLFASSGNNAETLYNRLQSLVRAWSQGARGDEQELVVGDIPPPPETPHAEGAPAPAPPPSRASELLPQMRDLLAFALENAVAAQIVEAPELSAQARALADMARKANSVQAIEALLAELKRFAYRLELLADDRSELRAGLLHLLQLIVDNIGELVVDDQWLQGQIAVIRDIVARPLSLRTIDDAERRIKEVVFKQSQLKHSLVEAKEALKTMLAGFVDHLAEFAESTSDYHDKIEACAQKISAADDINQLADVVQEVMRETRVIQLNAQRSRDELQATRRRVQETEQRIGELQHELEKASSLVRHDQLTGALNRRGLEEAFDKEAARAQRRRMPLCLALLDIDNFKKLNDSLGHDAGDAALIHLATVIRESMRPQDTVARFGGEEFVILLPDTALDDANRALVRLQRELTKRFFLHNNDKLLITFSAGVTELRSEDSQDAIMKRADRAMYAAKAAGKNRVQTA